MLHSTELADLGRAFACQKPAAMLIAYEQEFRRMREAPFTLLEIGVKKGGSLRMWEAYFPHARIIGVDIKPSKLEGLSDRVRLLTGDQGDPAFLEALVRDHGPFGIVIDDGSHMAEHQRVTFETLFPDVVDGGLYVIEDMHSGYQSGYNPTGEPPAVEYLAGLAPFLCLSTRDPERTAPGFLASRTPAQIACGSRIARIAFARRTAIIETHCELTGPPWDSMQRLARDAAEAL